MDRVTCDLFRFVLSSQLHAKNAHAPRDGLSREFSNGMSRVSNTCRCGPIAVRSTLKPTSHPYPKKDNNVWALTRAAQHLIKPTAYEKWSCSKRWLVLNGMSSEQACPKACPISTIKPIACEKWSCSKRWLVLNEWHVLRAGLSKGLSN